DNFITVNRDEPNGGVVTTAAGETSVEVTVGDGVADVIEFAHTDASNSLFRYVVTDEAGIILGLPPANEVDFEGAGPGTCLVWGLAYTGELTAQMGDNALEVALTDGCFDLSDEAVSVVRVMGGQNININPSVQTRANTIADLTVSPNPIQANFNVQFNFSEATRAQLSIYNIYGQLVETRNVEAAAGFNQYDLDGSRFVAGNYIVELRTADATYNVSIVKQ
ncbi:MAG: T9SS type A sorting domain-containing protein, partial [Bacteroidota bacterium]